MRAQKMEHKRLLNCRWASKREANNNDQKKKRSDLHQFCMEFYAFNFITCSAASFSFSFFYVSHSLPHSIVVSVVSSRTLELQLILISFFRMNVALIGIHSIRFSSVWFKRRMLIINSCINAALVRCKIEQFVIWEHLIHRALLYLPFSLCCKLCRSIQMHSILLPILFI